MLKIVLQIFRNNSTFAHHLWKHLIQMNLAIIISSYRLMTPAGLLKKDGQIPLISAEGLAVK